MYENIEKLKVIVFVKDREGVAKHAKLFFFLMGDRVVNAKKTRDECWLYGEDFTIHFMVLGERCRGHRAHVVINLVQDQQLNNEVAIPIERFDQLKYDLKWAFLF